MSTADNIKAIELIYEAFGRGDIAAILDGVTDDVDWASEANSSVAPWYGIKRGKAAIGSFFETFGSLVEVDEFVPLTLAGNDTDVLSVVHLRARVRKTGKPMEMDLHHFFRFEKGKIAYYRGTEDTAQVAEALAG